MRKVKSGAGRSFGFSTPVPDSTAQQLQVQLGEERPFLMLLPSSSPRGHLEHLTRTLQVYSIIFPGPRTYRFVSGSSCL